MKTPEQEKQDKPQERIYGKHYSNCCNTTCVMQPIEYWEGGETPAVLIAEVCVCPNVYKDPKGKSHRCGKPQYVKIHPGHHRITETDAKRLAMDGVLFVVSDKSGKLVEYQSKRFKSYDEIMRAKEKPSEVLFASFVGKSVPHTEEETEEVPF